MNIYEWRTAGGKNEISNYFSKRSKAEQAEYKKARELIIEYGCFALEKLDTRQLRGKLWEIKLSQNRIMYAVIDGDNIFFLHACKKQKGSAEKFELAKAISRAKKVELL